MKLPLSKSFSPALLLSLSLSGGALAKPAKQVVPVYDLEGAISESGQATTSLLSLDFSGTRPLTMLDVVKSLAAAAADDNVPAIVMDIDDAGLQLAQIEEIRRHLQAVRDAGKDIYIYTENLGNGTALLGSAANHFTLMPEGGVSFTGLYSESMYYKGLFDKAGVRVDVVHIGDFKSAGETFSRSGPSDPAKAQQAALLDATYNELVRGVAKSRGLKPKEVRALIDDGALTPERAKEAGLVDALEYRTDFISALREKYPEATFDKGYQLPDLDGPEIDSMLDVMKLMFASGKDKRFTKDYIAVVPMEGAITSESIKPARSQILRAARDEKCKGLVLRVNSPGGSAAASDVLWEATAEFKATGKPFVVSMGGVAASGGYYISAGADQIFAERGTVTGSIGVVGMKIAIGGALDKLGIAVHGQKRGRFADAMSMTHPLDEEQEKMIRRSMLDVYGTFKQRIVDGRGDRIQGELENHAGGRVYSGAAALEIGLVDRIGGLAEAVWHVAEQAKIDDPPVYLLPEPKGALDGLFGAPSTADPNGEFIGAPRRDAQPAFGLAETLRAGGLLQVLDPWKQRELDRALQLLEAARGNTVMLLGPAFDIRLD